MRDGFPKEKSLRQGVRSIAALPIDPDVFKRHDSLEVKLLQTLYGRSKINRVFNNTRLQAARRSASEMHMRSMRKQRMDLLRAVARSDKVTVVQRQGQAGHVVQERLSGNDVGAGIGMSPEVCIVVSEMFGCPSISTSPVRR